MATIDKREIKDFVERWKGRGREDEDSQQFWLQLLRSIGYEYCDSVLFEKRVSNGGKIDVWLRESGVLIEQKSISIDLDRPELRQGQMKTPLQQALDYAEDLRLSDQPNYIITCNFKSFRVYDRTKYGRSELENNAFEFSLEEFEKHPEYFDFVTDPKNSRLEKEKEVSIQAGELIGQLYDMLREGYIDPDGEEAMHALNVLCVRLVFCLYCEDADLFEKNAFYKYLKDIPASGIRAALKRLFNALDTEIENRDPYDLEVRNFPYVNGGLFRESSEIPNFTETMKSFLLDEVSASVDWSQISPTIFGGIFESTLNPETRRSGGMHYTSPENIHKVIDPLFLDELKAEFVSIRDKEGITPRKRKNALTKFHEKICNIRFLDPACGSGNFLTETYICLRRLEDLVLSELRNGQAALGISYDEDEGQRISLGQFYGIEINDFAVTVAETALWISRLKANGENFMLWDGGDDDFPLHEKANIIHGNATQLDWNAVLPSHQCTFIIGNPPFIGHQWRTKSQQEDMDSIFEGVHGYGKLDYVCAWYELAANYIKNQPIRCAFVSTNSICQGESVGILWKHLIDIGIEIDFAFTTFVWNSEASDQAHVHVVIVGFSYRQWRKPQKVIYYADGTEKKVDYINGYLSAAPDVYIENRGSSVNGDVPQLTKGSQETGGNSLVLSAEEKEELLRKYPQLINVIRPYCGSREFLNGGIRYCLWFADSDISEYRDIPEISDRLDGVVQSRLSSKTESVQRDAQTPWLFTQIRQPDSDYIFVPRVSSGRRKYVPLDFVSKNVIITSDANLIASDSLFIFGLLSSYMHNAWLHTVGGRMKSDFRYSPSVYNSFVFPNASSEQENAIASSAKNVLTVRSRYTNKTLAELYDPDHMPTELKEAHLALDKDVENAYGVSFNGDEEKIVEHLFKLYAAVTQK